MTSPAMTIRLRLANQGDCENVYAWRNHPDTRKAALDKSAFSLESHRKWFAGILNDTKRFLLIAESETGAVGVAVIDASSEHAWISVYLKPGLYGQGLGTSLLLEATRWMRANHPETCELYAHIVTDNPASIRAFEKAGYQPYALVYKKDFSHEE